MNMRRISWQTTKMTTTKSRGRKIELEERSSRRKRQRLLNKTRSSSGITVKMLSLVVVVLFVAHHSFLPTTQASTEPKAEEHVFCAVASHTGRPHAQDATTSISRQPQQQPASKVKSNKVPNSNNTCIGLVFGDVVDNDFEYEENAGIQSNKVGDRLKSHSFFGGISPPQNTP